MHLFHASCKIRGPLFCALALGLAACADGTNESPLANAGPAQNVDVGTTITLDGSASTGGDGGSLSYRWKLTGWPIGSQARLSDPTLVKPVLTIDKAGAYVVSLTVDDGTASSAPASVVIRAGQFSERQATTYLPFDTTAMSCTATTQWIYGPETGQQIALASFDYEVVPYTSGARVGLRWGEVLSPTDYVLFDLNGPGLRILAADDLFASTDCSLTAHPTEFLFDILFDGMIIDHSGAYWVNRHNYADCQPSSGRTLVKFEDVTVGVQYKNAMVWWGIDTQYSFSPISFPNIGISVTLPNSSDTGGYSVTDWSIFAPGLGEIASGDIDAATGVVLDARAVVAGSCNR